MRKAIDTIFFLSTVAIVALVGYYFWSMSYRHVAQSESWITLDTAKLQRKDLFEDFPVSATELRYSNTVAGMRGWCFVFAVRAPLADLHTFAAQELNQYSGNIVRTNNCSFPFAESTPTDLHRAYSVDVNWLSDAVNVVGVKYELDSFAGPMIFIDEASETMYYVCTD